MGFLTACAPAVSPKSLPIAFQLDAGGVELVELEKRVDFGRTRKSTIGAMTKIIGATPVAARECGELNTVAWRDGTKLVFAKNRFQEWSFRGWQTDESSAGLTCPLA